MIILLIRKRYVYLDAPMKIESNKGQIEKEKQEENIRNEQELLEMVARANKEAEQIVFSAQNQVQQMIQQAQEEYNKIIEEANKRSKEIIDNTVNEVEETKRELNERIKSILFSFETSFDNLLSMYSEKIATITKILVEKFLEKEIDSEVTKRKIEKVLSHVVGATKVKIHINPEDAKLIDQEILDEIRSKNYEVVLNDSVSQGVIVETDLGTIDTTLKFQFALLDEIFDEVFKQEL